MLFELFVWPREVEPWFQSWYRGRVETLGARKLSLNCLCGHVKWSHGYRSRVNQT